MGACGPATAPDADLATWAGSRSRAHSPAPPTPRAVADPANPASQTAAPQTAEVVPPVAFDQVDGQARTRAEALDADGVAAQAAGNLEAAQVAYTAAIATDPGNVVARYHLARAVNTAGAGDRALALLGQIAAAECVQCRELLHLATYDDDWASQWMRPTFVDLTTSLDEHATVGVQSSRWYRDANNGGCPGETTPRGEERRQMWCENRAGAKHGPYTEWYSGDYALGSVKSAEGAYRDGKRHGYWVYFDITGAISNSGAYVDGDKAGRWVEYFSVGTDYYGTEGVFVAGEPNGTHKTWRFAGESYDQLHEVGDYDAGAKTGAWTEYYPNGRPKRVSHYQDGALDGAVSQWTADGALLGEQTFEAGTGTWTTWHDNGQITEQGEYASGRRAGTWTRWDDAGTEIERRHYEDGALHGAYQRWHANGERAEAGSYASDARTGAWTTWYFNGETASRGSYRAGKRHGAWTYWDVGGNKAREGIYKAGLEHGTWTRYYDGSKEQQGGYRDGARHGTWTTWHVNGRVASRGTYVAGVRSGTWTFWFDDGAKRATGRYKADAPTGAWTVWPDGVTRRTVRVDSGVITAIDGQPASEQVSAFIPQR